VAHEIEAGDMIATRTTPWHGLGVTTGEHMTSEQAMKLAKLDNWKVDVTPLHVTYPDGQVEEVPGRFATVRTDTNKLLGVVGDRYEIVQNEELFEFADALVDTGDAHYESAGSLRDNKVVFLTMELERPVKVADVDFKPFLNVTSSHDGSFAFRAGVSPTVIVCMNTLRLAIDGAAHEYTIKHTMNVADRIAQAREALRISFDYYDGFDAEIVKLIDTDVTNRKFESIMRDLFPEGTTEIQGRNAQEKREAIRVVYKTDPSSAPWQGSAWGVLNAVNTWEMWGADIRKTDSVSENPLTARLERTATKFLRGTEAPLTQQVHKLLVKAGGRK
jgi:phage/plasmid-like protein (TIGR03299 family)